jgi:hypothetical protein
VTRLWMQIVGITRELIDMLPKKPTESAAAAAAVNAPLLTARRSFYRGSNSSGMCACLRASLVVRLSIARSLIPASGCLLRDHPTILTRTPFLVCLLALVSFFLGTDGGVGLLSPRASPRLAKRMASPRGGSASVDSGGALLPPAFERVRRMALIHRLKELRTMRAIVFPPSGMYVMGCAYLRACWERGFITWMSARTLHNDTDVPQVG